MQMTLLSSIAKYIKYVLVTTYHRNSYRGQISLDTRPLKVCMVPRLGTDMFFSNDIAKEVIEIVI